MKQKLFKKIMLITNIIIISLVFTACETGKVENDNYFTSEHFKQESAKKINTWNRLMDNGLGQELDISVEDKGIRVTAEGVIADEINTFILIKIEDLEGNKKFTRTHPVDGNIDEYEWIELSGDIEKNLIEYSSDDEYPPIVNVKDIYQREKNINKLLLKTNKMRVDSGNINIKIRDLLSMEYYDLQTVDRRQGNWDIDITAEKLDSKEYIVDKVLNIDENNITINKVTIAPTETKVEYTFNTFNSKKPYFINSYKFLLENEGEVYKDSILSEISSFHVNKVGRFTATASLESIYIEDPEEIDIIVQSYEYSNPIQKYYELDLDNLPQTLEYYDSKVIVESVKYTEDTTEIVIKEDTSEDREYFKSTIYTKGFIEDADNGSWIFQQYSQPIRVYKPEEKVEIQTIVIDIKEVTSTEINEDNKDRLLKPKEIYIQGQKYIKYPNKKINLKLK